MTENPESCIFCLSDDPKTILYKGICNCHPSIHSECINLWFEKNPTKCPICLISTQPINIIIINNHNYRAQYICLFVCTVFCMSIICSPFLLIALIINLSHRPGNSYYHNVTRI